MSKRNRAHVIRRLRAMGLKVERNGSDHYTVTLPNGNTVGLANTYSDHRTPQNEARDFRKKGYPIHWKKLI